MQGQMMNRPLLISGLLEHAEQVYPGSEIVSRQVEGGIHRYTYADAGKRCRKLANALARLGVEPGDRVGTLAWNTNRHYELYFAVSGVQAVVHTVNPRLFPEQIVYIINHAEDRYLFVDLTFVALLESFADQLTSLRGIIVMTDRANMPNSSIDGLLCYEELLEAESDQYDWPSFSEESAAALCYTSGTTGNPKGVLYSHRSTILHAQAICQPQALNISSDSIVLPVVPMFHVCAWGSPYAVTLTGAKLVFPGPNMDGESLHQLIDAEQVNMALGVPTIWMGLLAYMKEIGKTLESVESVVVGGAAASQTMIQQFEETHGIFLVHAWGMTETSPLGTISSCSQEMKEMPLAQRYKLQQKQGRPIYGVSIKIVDDDGVELARDGKAFGRLLITGPWIAASYFREDHPENFIEGWFDTGDVATIDSKGYMQIVDRRKDVIKSGGEWISSIELENAALGHPSVTESCVIGVAHPKWDERPILLIVKKSGETLAEAEMIEFLTGKVAKWWLPDAVVFVEELPHTATGKLLKMTLREQYQSYLIDR
ncbi:MAG: long-chain-fatty-acid--CoA ligase [Pseudomonadales bacterium]|nr:long-chain-fatty-acid--CoA ligase [Pseudomonadales bacterium]